MKRGRYGTQGCGTRAGYQRHKALGGSPCEACREAQRTYMREYARARYTPEQRRAKAERAKAAGYYTRWEDES